MKVRLRFRCVHKGEQIGYQSSAGKSVKVGSVKLAPVYPQAGDADEAEIKEFYNATPSGQCEFATINQAALEAFEVGKDYYLTVEAVPPQPAAE